MRRMATNPETLGDTKFLSRELALVLSRARQTRWGRFVLPNISRRWTSGICADDRFVSFRHSLSQKSALNGTLPRPLQKREERSLSFGGSSAAPAGNHEFQHSNVCSLPIRKRHWHVSFKLYCLTRWYRPKVPFHSAKFSLPPDFLDSNDGTSSGLPLSGCLDHRPQLGT